MQYQPFERETDTPPPYEKELRLGLVLYGGVSLAVYIYGVTNEFVRLVRGDGPYAALAEKARVKPVLDVISGSSAGGINGLAVAKALTTGADFGVLKEMWVQNADFCKLLDAENPQPKALFNSDFYLQTLEDALKKMTKTEGQHEAVQYPLDVFVTATNLDGLIAEHYAPYLFQPFATKRHTSVFHLKTRPGSYNPFGDGMGRFLSPELIDNLPIEEVNHLRTLRNDFSSPPDSGVDGKSKDHYLARIAASTSAFPFVFAPVRFEYESHATIQKLFTDNLVEWGLDEPVVFADGGMLDNKPFSYTTRTIFRRQAFGPVDRKLLFVEPNPPAASKDRIANLPQPDGFDSLRAFISAKLEESITSDLRTIGDRNRRIADVKFMLNWFEEKLEEFIYGLAGDELTIRQAYREYVGYAIYVELKLFQLKQRGREYLMALPVQDSASQQDTTWREPLVERLLSEMTLGEAEQVEFLQDFDFPFRIRQLRYFISKIDELLDKMAGLPETRLFLDLRAELSDLKAALYVYIEYYFHNSWLIWQSVDAVNAENFEETFVLLRARHKQVMNSGVKPKTLHLLQTALRPVIEKLITLKARYPNGFELSSIGRMLIDHFDTDFETQIAQIFKTYEFIDMHLYPALILADIGEADPIDIFRVSPKDAHRYEKSVAEKLAGEKYAHFSGFLKKDWRRNDILWGRLDAAEIIVRLMLPNDETAQKQFLDQLAPAIIAEELGRPVDREKREVLEKLFLRRPNAERVIQKLTTRIEEETKAREASFRREYDVGEEGLQAVSRDYLFSSISRMFITVGNMIRSRYRGNWLALLTGLILLGLSKIFALLAWWHSRRS